MRQNRLTLVVYANKLRSQVRAIEDWCYSHFDQGANAAPLVVTLEEKRPQRTSAQNRYMWPMLQQIADAYNKREGTHHDRYVMKHFFLNTFYGARSKLVMGEEVAIPWETSSMTADQMRDFITKTMAFAADQGFVIMMPDDYLDWANEAA